MKWSSYKALCDEPRYWSRWMLEHSSRLFASMGAHDLEQALNVERLDGPLQKPADHTGPPATDMFLLELPVDDRLAALQLIKRAVDEGCTADGRNLGGFVEAWREYAEAGMAGGSGEVSSRE